MTKIRSYAPKCRILVNHSLYIEGQLGDSGGVYLSKSLYSPTGEFSLNFPDHPYHNGGSIFGPVIEAATETSGGGRRSLYDMVSPMDPIEIHLTHNEDGAIVDYVTVLRGFVRSVGRDEKVGSDGRVERRIVIAGHDFGAAFLMQQMGAILSAAINKMALPPAFAYLRDTGLSTAPLPVGDFIWGVASSLTKDIMESAGYSFQKEFSVKKGYCLPMTALAGEGAVWEVLKRYSDAPWNELFIREGSRNPELVFRPTPWKDASDMWLPDALATDVTTWNIPMSQIFGLSAHRDDADQVEHSFVQNQGAIMQQNWFPLLEGMGEFNTSLRKKFGDRIQQLTSYIGPSTPGSDLAESSQNQSYTDFYSWIKDRMAWVRAAGTDIYKLEKGSINIKGDPRIRVGDYVHVQRGPVAWTAYIVAVEHTFQPYRQFMTTVQYIRSNQWIKRNAVSNAWDAERKTS